MAKWADIELELADISVAGRILGAFADVLPPEQRKPDTLGELGKLAKTAEANIVKLPNVSASVPQLVEAVAELQAKGFALPDFVQSPSTAAEKDAYKRYATVLGSAVNPVLREGNSDRRVAPPVKAYAQKNPHRLGKWKPESRTRVAHMEEGDFYSSEQSHVQGPAAGSVRIELVKSDGSIEARLALSPPPSPPPSPCRSHRRSRPPSLLPSLPLSLPPSPPRSPPPSTPPPPRS